MEALSKQMQSAAIDDIDAHNTGSGHSHSIQTDQQCSDSDTSEMSVCQTCQL